MSIRIRRQSAALAIFCTLAFMVAIVAQIRLEPREKDEAASLKNRPADWQGFARLAESALYSDEADPVALWRAAYAHSTRSAPYRPQPHAAFVRAGMFHWPELSDADRAQVKAVAAPLLKDPHFFERTHAAFLGTTGDFAFLRQNMPHTLGAIIAMRRLAVENGLFDDYRDLRNAETRQRLLQMQELNAVEQSADILALLPEPLRAEHRALVQVALDKLESAPVAGKPDSGRVTRLIEFALDHDMKPLDGLVPVIADSAAASSVARARLAVATGELDAAAAIRLADSHAPRDWRRYHVDRALVLARRGDFAAADTELFRAADGELDALVLSAVAELARLRNDASLEADALRRLEAFAARPPQWSNLCDGAICGWTSAVVYSEGTRALPLTLTSIAGDDVQPYVEIAIDGTIADEGPADGRTRSVLVPRGVHEVRIEVANARWAGGQRRVRMS